MLTLWSEKITDRALAEIHNFELTLILTPTLFLTLTQGIREPSGNGSARAALGRVCVGRPRMGVTGAGFDKKTFWASQEQSALLNIRIPVFTLRLSSHPVNNFSRAERNLQCPGGNGLVPGTGDASKV